MITALPIRWEYCLIALISGCIEAPRMMDSPATEPPPVAEPEPFIDGASRIELDRRRLVFEENTTQRLTVTNRGEQPLIFARVEQRGSDAFAVLRRGRAVTADTWRDPDDDGEPGLAPQGVMVLDVTYTSADLAVDLGTIEFETNDPARPVVQVELRGERPAPCFDIRPAALDFGALSVGANVREPLRILTCDDTPFQVRSYTLTPQSDSVFSAGSADTDLPAPSVELTVDFAPDVPGDYRGELMIFSDAPDADPVVVPIAGRGVQNACPVPVVGSETIRAVPLDVITLDGGASTDDGPDGQPAEYEWVVIESPDGSTSQPTERFFNNQQPANGGEVDDRTTPTAQFFIDLQGTYVFELRVRDVQGLGSVECDNAAQVIVVAEADKAIRIELEWDDDGGDTVLDLHLLHPNADGWFSSPYDAYDQNPEPDWGQLENPADDPQRSEEGATRVTWLDIPENTDVLGAPYVVGVHANRLSEPIVARVRIFIDGELAREFAVDGASERLMESENDFWDVAAIEWPRRRVVIRDRYFSRRP